MEKVFTRRENKTDFKAPARQRRYDLSNFAARTNLPLSFLLTLFSLECTVLVYLSLPLPRSRLPRFYCCCTLHTISAGSAQTILPSPGSLSRTFRHTISLCLASLRLRSHNHCLVSFRVTLTVCVLPAWIDDRARVLNA